MPAGLACMQRGPFCGGRVTGRGSASRCAKASGFDLSLVSNLHGQPTPLTAAMWFSEHGRIVGIPQHGWRMISRSIGGMTSDRALLPCTSSRARTKPGRSIVAADAPLEGSV